MNISVNNLGKAYGGEQVLRDVSFAVAKDHTLAVLGRSGSGKTTLLKIIAGLLPADTGTVSLGGRDVTRWPPQQRQAVYLYQEPLLFPHLSVFENIAFGLRIRKTPDRVVRQKVQEMLFALELENFGHKHPDQLSGGQKQRTAFGRALIIEPPVLLLDEPFGSLDVDTRNAMQSLFQQLAAAYKITSIFVTHDIREALLVGDSLGFLERGVLTHYPDRASFIKDARTGASREIDFWKNL